jgi:STIP1 family protein 1
MTRLKLEAWDACIDDCIRSIELEPGNMKGYYYLAQAQLALHHPNEALNSAMTAYEACLKTKSSSTRSVSSLVLQAKKEKWEAKERERIRMRSELLAELEDGLDRTAESELQRLQLRVSSGEVGESEAAEEKEEIELSRRKKIEELRHVFGVADPANLKKRVRSISPPSLLDGWLMPSDPKIGSSRLPH